VPFPIRSITDGSLPFVGVDDQAIGAVCTNSKPCVASTHGGCGAELDVTVAKDDPMLLRRQRFVGQGFVLEVEARHHITLTQVVSTVTLAYNDHTIAV
jgi:hypothetical protein